MDVVEIKWRQFLQTVLTSEILQLTLRIDALFEQFKQSANKLSKIVKFTTLIH